MKRNPSPSGTKNLADELAELRRITGCRGGDGMERGVAVREQTVVPDALLLFAPPPRRASDV